MSFRQPTRDPKVQDLGAAVAIADDVRALEIAMEDAALMRVPERLRNLAAEVNGRVRRQAAARG